MTESAAEAPRDDWWQFWNRRLQMGWERGVAIAQLRFDAELQAHRDRLALTLETVREHASITPLVNEIEPLVRSATLAPPQLAATINDLPVAADRALVAATVGLVVTTPEGTDPRNTTETRTAYADVARHCYATSGFPLVTCADGNRIDAISASLLTVTVAIAVSQATAAGLGQFFGPGELQTMLTADGLLWREALTTSQQAMPGDDNWHAARTTLDETYAEQSDDPILSATQLGIQGAQIGEFVANRVKDLLRSDPVQLLVPGPFKPALTVVQFLSSDLVLNLGNIVESSLDVTTAARQLELVLSTLFNSADWNCLPHPSLCLTGRPTTIAAMDASLSPLLAQQVTAIANGLDPQLRNRWLDDVGQQLNTMNPIQLFQGWLNHHWMADWQQAIATIRQTYPTSSALKLYAEGLDTAARQERLMDQARQLRTLGRQLEDSSSPDT